MLSDQDSRMGLLIQLVTEVTARGDHGRAVRLAHEAEALIAQITDPFGREDAWSSLVKVVAAMGDLDWAGALLEKITHLDWREDALDSLAEAAVANGDLDKAAQLVGEAEALSAQSADPCARAEPLCRLAEAVAVSGDPDRAT